jgi:FAD/FMN-containing dehydrogenase
MEHNWLDKLRITCPDLRICVEASVLESHGVDRTRFLQPKPCAVAFPESAAQVQALVSCAATHGIALVPSGGRTGLSGGAVATNGELIVSFDRMRKILEFDAVDRTLRVEAGVVTAAVQAYASENDLFYPVSFAAEGSSQIGGNVATNAGGIRVLRHGLTRDRVVGMKVVCGRGELLDCNRGLIKNASGYDLRHLFIGSEGTLGLIVEVTLQLIEPPPASKVMFLGLDNMEDLMNVFATLRRELGLSAFEFLTDKALRHVRRANDLPAPLDTSCGLYVITEFDCSGDAELDKAISCFEHCADQGWVLDGIISQNNRQIKELWRYREGISESISSFTPYKNDLSVRVSKVPEFLRQMDQLVAELCPDLEVLWYGHIGDGNLHLNILKPEDWSLEEFERRAHEISERTYALTQAIGGSISAEHGIGILKSPWLDRVRSEDEIRMMRGIKQVFDPAGIFNPGKLFP